MAGIKPKTTAKMLNYCPSFANKARDYGMRVAEGILFYNILIISNPTDIAKRFYSSEPDISNVIKLINAEPDGVTVVIHTANTSRWKMLLEQSGEVTHDYIMADVLGFENLMERLGLELTEDE